jgi:hypothetical protein
MVGRGFGFPQNPPEHIFLTRFSRPLHPRDIWESEKVFKTTVLKNTSVVRECGWSRISFSEISEIS